MSLTDDDRRFLAGMYRHHPHSPGNPDRVKPSPRKDTMSTDTEHTASTPRFPDVTVKLVGENGNAFAVLGAVSKALKRAGHREAADEFMAEATSGDYNHLLQTAMRYVDVT